MRVLHDCILRVTCCALLSMSVGAEGLFGGEPKVPWKHDVIAQLLEFPVPAADWRKAPTIAPTLGKPPADDAPGDLLLAFWTARDLDFLHPRRSPGEKVRSRLLELGLAHPADLPPLLQWLPDDTSAQDRLKALYDRTLPAPGDYYDLQAMLHDWLMRHSRYFRDELIRAAKNTHLQTSGPFDDDELGALARLDWRAAEPILKENARSDDARFAAQALVTLYEQAARAGDIAKMQEYRARLKTIAADRQAPQPARDRAIVCLSGIVWEGQSDWYLSLFNDPTLSLSRDGRCAENPLWLLPTRAPHRWIPILAEMASGSDRAKRDNAVACLIRFSDQIDALRPLLPWLSDPDWSLAPDRLRLIQGLARVDLPQSIDGLLHVLQHEGGAAEAAAAVALAHYHTDRAREALYHAYNGTQTGENAKRIVQAMLDSGALNRDEILSAIEAYCRTLFPRPQPAAPPIDLAGTVQIELGAHLADLCRSRESVARAVLEQSAALRPAAPELADEMSMLSADWPSSVFDKSLVSRLKLDSRDAAFVHLCFKHASGIRANCSGQLHSIATGGGIPAGLAVALLADPSQERALLTGNDAAARDMLLACARNERAPLPLEAAAPLLKSPEPRTALAAKLYLSTLDTPPARELLWSTFPDQLMVLGPGSDSYNPRFDNFEVPTRLAKLLRDPSGPDEIYVLLDGSGGEGISRSIQIRGKAARMEIDRSAAPGPEGITSRDLTDAEHRELVDFISTTQFDALPPLKQDIWDGIHYDYLHLTRKGGCLVFMNNPGDGESVATPYHRLVRLFQRLETSGQFKWRGMRTDRSHPGDGYFIFAISASAKSLVPAVPPRSRVSVFPSPSTAS